MKKFAILLAAALPFVFAACGDDNDENSKLTIENAPLTLNYDDDFELKASEKNVSWSSSNDFVATIDAKGKVEAKHEGTVVITATKDGNKATCTIEVKATNNNFVLPILTWGATMEQVKGAVPNTLHLEISVGSTLAYNTPGNPDNYPFYVYEFNSNGLNASSLSVSTDTDEELDLEDFLDQRYKAIEETEAGYLYVNANSKVEATMRIEYGLDAVNDQVTVVWTPMIPNRSGVTYDAAAVKACREMAKKLLNK